MIGLGQTATDESTELVASEDGMLANGIVDLNAPSPEQSAAEQGPENDESTKKPTAIAPESNAIATDVSKALLSSCFSEQVESLGEEVLCDLLASSVIEVQSFATETVLRHRELRRLEVTGLTVNERVSVSRKQLRNFRATLHQIEKNGPAGSQWVQSPDVIAAISGFANFVAMEEPEKRQKLQAPGHANH